MSSLVSLEEQVVCELQHDVWPSGDEIVSQQVHRWKIINFQLQLSHQRLFQNSLTLINKDTRVPYLLL